MSNHRLFVRWAAPLVLLAVSVAASAQPRLDFSCEQIATGPLPAHVRQQVEQFVAHWTDVMLTTEADAEVSNARQRLVEGFAKCPDSAQYQTAYAAAVVDSVRPVLRSQDRLRQVNAALVVANTRNMRIRPVLDEMVRHDNPAVRYLGWQGYQRVRTLVLAQGRAYSEPMFAGLDEQLKSETVPFVLRRLLEMLYLPPVRPQVISEGDYRWARERAMEIFLAGWSEQCGRILLGGGQMPDAMRRGLWAISGFRRIIGDSQAERSKLAQPLLDVMYCASRAYDEADAGSDGDRVRRANAMLLSQAEEELHNLTELRRGHVSRALEDPDVPDRGAEVRRAVLQWVDDLADAGYDIEQPRFESPRETAGENE